jgi:hypothetical protein
MRRERPFTGSGGFSRDRCRRVKIGEKQFVNLERASGRPAVLLNFDCAERCIVLSPGNRPSLARGDIGFAAT